MNSDINNLPTLNEFLVMVAMTIAICIIAYKFMKREDDKVKKGNS